MYILFSDFDWTLCPHGDQEQFTKNLAAIEEWHNAGNEMGVATGRNVVSLEGIFPNYRKYIDYAVLNDGSEIYNRDKKVASIKLRRGLVQELKATIDSFSLTGEMAIISYDDEEATQTIGKSANKIRLWFEDQDDCAYASRTLAEYYYERIKLLTYYKVKENFDTRAFSWVKPHMCYFLEIIPHGVNKQSGINMLFDYNRHRDIITVGDDMNDYEMISFFNGYAVRGGNPELLAHVSPQHVVDSLESLIHKLLKSPV